MYPVEEIFQAYRYLFVSFSTIVGTMSWKVKFLQKLSLYIFIIVISKIPIAIISPITIEISMIKTLEFKILYQFEFESKIDIYFI